MKMKMGDRMVEVKRVPYTIVQDQITVIHVGNLELKIRLVITEIYEIVGELNNKGNPVYQVEHQAIVTDCDISTG